MTTLTYGTMVKTVRTVRGWDQRTLSAQADVNRAYLSQIEQDRLTPTPNIARKIEAAFNLRFDDPQVEAAFLVLADAAAQRGEVLAALTQLNPSITE